MARQSLSKTVRFEVFKRDKFTCQYCGRSAPDIILEVDHIQPVSKGGKNEIMNLVTSCRDCNRGKSNKELSDTSAVKVQRQQLEAMQDRREQLEMMRQWRDELQTEEDIQIDMIDSTFMNSTKWGISDHGRIGIRKLIRRFGFQDVCTAVDIAITKYYDGTERGWNEAYNKIGGVCYNRRKASESNA